jgi:hypothetical protein
VPIVIHSAPLRIATGEVFQAINDNMRSLCEPVGNTFVDPAEGLEVALNWAGTQWTGTQWKRRSEVSVAVPEPRLFGTMIKRR